MSRNYFSLNEWIWVIMAILLLIVGVIALINGVLIDNHTQKQLGLYSLTVGALIPTFIYTFRVATEIREKSVGATK